jgi:hypothetical protein
MTDCSISENCKYWSQAAVQSLRLDDGEDSRILRNSVNLADHNFMRQPSIETRFSKNRSKFLKSYVINIKFRGKKYTFFSEAEEKKSVPVSNFISVLVGS